MDNNFKATLGKTVLFADIDVAGRDTLINCLAPHIRQFSRNEILLLTGDSVNHIGIILAGTASAYLEHIDGSQTLMSNLRPMSLFGEVLVSTRTHKSPVTVYATSEVTAAFIEYKRLLGLCGMACEAHRIFMQNMLKVIGDKYFRLFDRINILREKTLRAKILAILYNLSGRGAASHVTIPFSKTMLAEYLMVNRSALSKELRKMEDDGLIIVKGRDVKILRP